MSFMLLFMMPIAVGVRASFLIFPNRVDGLLDVKFHVESLKANEEIIAIALKFS